MKKTIAYIGLGSNLNNPKNQLKSALKFLNSISHSKLIAYSSFYHSIPQSEIKQPEYLNAVARLDTALNPYRLLSELQNIEKQQGRIRTHQKWGPRCIDLDLLLYANAVISNSNLTVPHPHLSERDFVLYPLLEIAGNIQLPDNTCLEDLIENCTMKSIKTYN